jgi:kynureninase
VELQEWSNGCKERPVCSLCSKNTRANCAVAQTWLDFAIIAQNRAKTTWLVLADGEHCKLAELQEWSNGCKERPVCSLCSKNTRANCAVAQTWLDFAIIAQNRAKTTWPVLANSVSCRVVMLLENDPMGLID